MYFSGLLRRHSGVVAYSHFHRSRPVIQNVGGGGPRGQSVESLAAEPTDMAPFGCEARGRSLRVGTSAAWRARWYPEDHLVLPRGHGLAFPPGGFPRTLRSRGWRAGRS
jgi:hypothetical protein